MGQRAAVAPVPTGAHKQRAYDGDYMDVGQEGEEIVLRFLRDQSRIVEVLDLRELRALQKADVDCSFQVASGQVFLVEIKTDNWLGKSGNILFEILRINHVCSPERCITLGWSGRTPAQYIFYYAPAVRRIYQCRTEALRASFQRYTRDCREAVQIKWVNTDRIKSTLNVLIPWRYCDDIFTEHDASPYLAAGER